MGEKRGPYKIAAPFQNCVLFGVLSIVALFNGCDEGDQHYGGNRSRSKNQQIERGPICVLDHVRKLTAWEDVAANALAARSAGKNLCPQSLPAQKGEKAQFCSSESRRGVQDRSALPGR